MSSELFLSGMLEPGSKRMINDTAVFMQCPYCRESVVLTYDKNTPGREMPYKVHCHKGRAKCKYTTALYRHPSDAWREHEEHMYVLHDQHEETM